MRLDSMVMSPVDGALVDRLQQLPVNAEGEKLCVFIAHIVPPENTVKMITSLPHLVE